MMSRRKKVMTPRSPRSPSPKPPARKPSRAPSTSPRHARAPGAATAAKPGDKKSVKSEKLSSSWADDAAKKRALKTRSDSGGGATARAGVHRAAAAAAIATATRPTFGAGRAQMIQEVHVPETISVADLAHKMSVKAAR
jgi:translation initiation factor IF-2